ncbi:uncharacterized protein LOC141632888 [Silene latifolia]|uniref:uncharacterized protein LOC141632888 n=1 Tax=Silene latifolia TaxID=37657 RepID=UPI003D776ACE
MDRFAKWSGLKPNISKTEIYFGGVSTAVKALILQHTGFFEGSFPFRYLGIPLKSSKNSAEVYGTLITKIQNALLHWSNNLLSYARRIQILNSVIFCIANFWCSAALLPKNILKRITKICKDYFRGIADGDRKHVFLSWKSVCRPSQEGGFNVKELLSWNKALLAKWIWLLISDSRGYWAQWNKAYVFQDNSIWQTSTKDRFSESWCSILKVKDEILSKTGSTDEALHIINSWVHNGHFQVVKAYNWFKSKGDRVYWFKALHGDSIIPSHKFTISLAIMHKLPTTDLLVTRGMLMVNRCVLCKCKAETHRHLFFNCVFSQQVWTALLQWMNIGNRTINLWSEIRWIAQAKGLRHWKHALHQSCIAAAVYFIWQERNQRIFMGRDSTVAHIISNIKLAMRYRLATHASSSSCLMSMLL